MRVPRIRKRSAWVKCRSAAGRADRKQPQGEEYFVLYEAAQLKLRRFGLCRGFRSGSRHLHFLVDVTGAGVESASEHTRESQHIVNLIGIVAASRGNNPGAASLSVIWENLGSWVSTGKYDCVPVHGTDHFGGDGAGADTPMNRPIIGGYNSDTITAETTLHIDGNGWSLDKNSNTAYPVLVNGRDIGKRIARAAL